MSKKVILITGASSGIGKSIAKFLLGHQYIVYGAARSTKKMDDLVSLGGKRIFLDVTNSESVSSCLNQIIKEEGRIDILINNAGYGSYGALENVSIEEAKNQFNVNVFGLAQITKEVLPFMRNQKSGRIINISSIAGKLTSPLGAWYFASKHAVEGLSDSLRQELKTFGIHVIIIEPGGVKSDWATIASQHLIESSKDTPYFTMAQKVSNYFPFIDKNNVNPEVISKLVLKAIEAKNPNSRYVGGKNAKILLFAKKILPDKLYDKIVLSQLKLEE